jgi:tetratricopeptide (TPR) repeat protein
MSGLDIAMPEDDDANFSADMEPPLDPRMMSAAGERHAEEISKILAETDVYVKYGLHQKAADHLRRVFTLDSENVEARERLKDIFVSQGREQEAEVELLRLVEVVAPSDPERAEAYLQEVLAMGGTHAGALELARRLRLRVARMPSASPEVEVSNDYSDAIALSDAVLDDLDVVSTSRPHTVTGHGHSKSRDSRDPIDDFDPAELLGHELAHGSPAPGRPPQRPSGGYVQAPDNFELDFGQPTGQMSPEIVEALATAREGDDLRGDRSSVHWAGTAGDRRSLDAQVGDDIDREVARELAHPMADSSVDEDLPFDPDEARAFDAAVPRAGLAGNTVETGPYDAVPEGSFRLSGSDDPYGTESLPTPATFTDSTVAGVASPDPEGGGRVEARAESNIEADLEDAEFYVGQRMYAEALDTLGALLARSPGNRMVLAKLREVEALAAGGDGTLDLGQDSIDAGSTTDAISIDDIEEVGVEDLVELDADSRPVASPKKRHPTVMLERPVDEGDSDTHYDLGLAYKEMALLDEAIKAFEKALRAPGREVQCRVMIGMCLREMGKPSDAIQQFKQGLHAEPIERERQSLYYEIGVTYEAIGDASEALYYFEIVLKRDPNFADTAARAERLRAGGGRAVRLHHDEP